MKVLHLLNSNRFSGAENVVCQIFGMMDNEIDMEMLYCSPDGEIRDALAERGVPFAGIKELSVSEVKRVLDMFCPDLIHAHDMKASFVAARACGKIPLISHIHNNAYDSRGISLKSIAYYFAAKKAKHIFWVSQSSYDGYCFHHALEQKSSVLYNVINIDTLYNRLHEDNNEYDYDIVYVGRLTYQKNPQRLMRVLEKCVNQLPEVRAAIIGTGELETETMLLAKELNIDKNVTFLGFQRNPLKMLLDAKVMIMTSRWEGTPMCALEAMALGVPIVSTPTDGLKELVLENQTGFLSEEDDKLVQRIVQIVKEESLRESLSKCSREKAKQDNDFQAYKQEILGCYTAVIANG